MINYVLSKFWGYLILTFFVVQSDRDEMRRVKQKNFFSKNKERNTTIETSFTMHSVIIAQTFDVVHSNDSPFN